MKIVIPCAGNGTRLKPETEKVPKELLSVGEKPMLEWTFDETAGLERIVVQSPLKYAHINDEMNGWAYKQVFQEKPRGLGDAILQTEPLFSDHEPVAIILPDDLIRPEPIRKMVTEYEKSGHMQVATIDVPWESVPSYGVIDRGRLVEKPNMDEVESRRAIVGRYVLPNKIFEALNEEQVGKDGELQLTDAIQRLVNRGYRLAPYPIEGKRYDCGHRQGLKEADEELSVIQ